MRSVRTLVSTCHTVQGHVTSRGGHPVAPIRKRLQSTIAMSPTKTGEFFDFSNAKPFEEIPSIRAFPLIGSSWIYMPIIGRYDLKKLHLANFDRYKRYGKIVREVTPLGHQLVHLYDPVDIETMFRFEGRTPYRIALEPLAAYRAMRKEIFGGGGLLIMQGDDWYKYRMKVQPHMFRPRSVQSYIPQMDSVACEMVQTIYDRRDVNGEVPEFLNQLYKWALESVALVAMDTKLGCLDPNLSKDSVPQQMIDAVQYAFEALLALSIRPPIWKYIPTPGWLKLVEVMDLTRNIANKYITEAIERIKTTNEEDRELTILESLLTITDFDKKDAMTMVGDMLIAGIDTSSTATAFTLYHLAKNPWVQEKLHKEVSQALSKKDGHIDQTTLSSTPYLHACFKETQRLNPVANGTIRRLNCDVLLSGYRVPAGTLAVTQNGVASQLEEYFSEPSEFRPERWMRETKEAFHPFASLPFGFGPRMCIGSRIADQEISLLLMRIIENFHVEYADEELGMVTRLVNAPDKPLRFKFIPRN